VSSPQDTARVKPLTRNLVIASVITTIAAVSWFGLVQHRRQIVCQQRGAALVRQIKSIEHDANEQLKIGTKNTDVARFFAAHGMTFAVAGSEASGELSTSGCAPFGCGTDSAVIGVRVKLDSAGSVAREPQVNSIYTNCL
jgi:hypothetical protein